MSRFRIEYSTGNRILKYWSIGGPRVGSVMVLVLERLLSAMCPKMQKKLLFGKKIPSSLSLTSGIMIINTHLVFVFMGLVV